MGQGTTCTTEAEYSSLLGVVTGVPKQGQVFAEFNRLMQQTAVVAREISAVLDPIIAHHEATLRLSERAMAFSSPPCSEFSGPAATVTNIG